MNDKSTILVIICKDCGYECITHKNGEVIKYDFIRVDNKNPFLRKWKCPKCNSEEHKFDHSKDCGCIYCKEKQRVNVKD